MFPYAEVERILAAVHARPPHRLPAFRARLTYLRKLGVPVEEGPGKGRRFQYSREHLLKLALVLEFAQLGINPELAAQMAQRSWPKLHKAFKRAGKAEGPVFLEVAPEFIGWTATSYSLRDPEASWELNPCTRDEAIRGLDDTTDSLCRRRCFINLSAVIKRIDREAAKAKDEAPLALAS